MTPGEIEEDLEDLNQQVALLTEGSARLENEHDILVIEKVCFNTGVGVIWFDTKNTVQPA